MKILLIISLALFVSCQKPEECKSGTVTIGFLQKSLSKTTSSASSDLPPDFHYTSADMERAIVGAWLNKSNDTVMIAALGQDSQIAYTIAGENAKCGPTCTRLHFLCSSQALFFPGILTFYESPDSGDVEIAMAERPYLLKNYKVPGTNCYTLIASVTDIPELGISIHDSLHMCK
jgi:hypothetical protein